MALTLTMSPILSSCHRACTSPLARSTVTSRWFTAASLRWRRTSSKSSCALHTVAHHAHEGANQHPLNGCLSNNAHGSTEPVTFMPLRTSTNNSGATVVVHGVGDSCGIICSQRCTRFAGSCVAQCTLPAVQHIHCGRQPNASNLQECDDQEVEVGNPTKLLKQIDWHECQHCELRRPNAIMSGANTVPNAKGRKPAP